MVLQSAFRLLIALSVTVVVDGHPSETVSQTHSDHSNQSTNTVAADRVLIGPEFLPRRTDLANKLSVPARQTVELPEQAEYDYIEVAGTLRASRIHDSTLRFTHLVVLPGGTLDIGTQADPIPCDRRVEFVVRDVPIDTTKDPFQWGNGLVNFGRQTRVGCAKTAWVEAAGTIEAGATTLMLASAPAGWQIGDELLIPDTAPPPASTHAPRRESPVTIVSIDGTQLALSKPLDFAHENVTDPQGAVVLRPRVANLTRNVVIRSENPNGTPGHSADVGQGAVWDIRYNRLSGLGRTRALPFDDTDANHVGTNQRGKYAEHHHHVQSAPAGADVGNVYVGHPKGKWGLVIHQTSDALIEQNIAVDFPGAGFVTEDGYEVRNVFRENFAAYTLGPVRDARGNRLDALSNVTRNCPGCESTGFWLRGVVNTFEGNEAWNNTIAGMNLFNQNQPDGRYPGVRGGKPDTALKHFEDRPISMAGNVVAANVDSGLELWGVSRFPNRDLIAANNTSNQVFSVTSDGVSVVLSNPKVICRVGTRATGIHAEEGYTKDFEMVGGQIAGCGIGITGGAGANGMTLRGTVLQNEINIDILPRNATFENVQHVPLGDYPHKYILFGNGRVWKPDERLPDVPRSYWMRQRGSRYIVKNWQGSGKDYQLFYRHSLAGNPAWYSAGWPHTFNTPVEGLTMQQSWDRYGLAFGGDVLQESDAVELDGLVNGLAREGLAVKLGPPRAIVTFPAMRETAVVQDGVVRLSAVLTGNPDSASRVMMVSVDGERPVPVDGDDSDDRSFTTTHTSPGVHEVKVWRTKKDKPGAIIPESEFTGKYCLGPCPMIPHGHITLSADSLTFSPPVGEGTPTTQGFTVSNSGVARMSVSIRTDPQSPCDVRPYVGRLEPGDSLAVNVFLKAPRASESFTCKVVVGGSSADNSPLTIPVVYNLPAERR